MVQKYLSLPVRKMTGPKRPENGLIFNVFMTSLQQFLPTWQMHPFPVSQMDQNGGRNSKF